MQRKSTRLWWLYPTWPFALMLVTTLVAALWQSPQAYELYGMPKYFNFEHLVVGVLTVVAFAVGVHWALTAGKNREINGSSRRVRKSDSGELIGELANRPTQFQQPSDEHVNFATGLEIDVDADDEIEFEDRPEHQVIDGFDNRVVYYAFWGCFALTLVGYVSWLLVGYKNGFHFGLFMEQLFTDNADLGEDIRNEMFVNIPGLTTCTQFAYALLAFGLWLQFKCKYSKVWWPIVIVLSLSAIRSVLLSERTALIELAFPLIFIPLRLWAMNRSLRPWFWSSLRVAPFVAPVLAVAFFGAYEYVRSWKYYQNDFNSYAEFTTWRLSGYLTTAHNNGAMALETNNVRPLPYWTVVWVWMFPGVPDSDFSYENLTGYNMEEKHIAMLENYGNKELNNEGGMFQPLLDYGLPLSMLFWVGYGYVSGVAYVSFLRGRFWGIVFYPLLLLSLLEVPLILFMLYTRTFPTLIALLAVNLWGKYQGKRFEFETARDISQRLDDQAIASAESLGATRRIDIAAPGFEASAGGAS